MSILAPVARPHHSQELRAHVFIHATLFRRRYFVEPPGCGFKY